MKQVFLQYYEIRFQKKEGFSLLPNFHSHVHHFFDQLMEQVLQVLILQIVMHQLMEKNLKILDSFL